MPRFESSLKLCSWCIVVIFLLMKDPAYIIRGILTTVLIINQWLMRSHYRVQLLTLPSLFEQSEQTVFYFFHLKLNAWLTGGSGGSLVPAAMLEILSPPNF
uniref:Uncharacterized protein n=1 Tax=Labrus bergylta TaxID=56723 RepID=A0A3Q3EJ47_9LABR